MKTPWSKLLNYGTGFATIIVMCVASIIVLLGIGAAVLLDKFTEFIK